MKTKTTPAERLALVLDLIKREELVEHEDGTVTLEKLGFISVEDAYKLLDIPFEDSE